MATPALEKKRESNPYVVSFGRIPNQFISRSLIIDNIVETRFLF